MPEHPHWYDDVATPALLRAARSTYGAAIRIALIDAGCQDLPRNGAFVVGAIARNGSPLREIMTGLGLSEPRASQLVDTLVVRGDLGRGPDGDAETRNTVTLTDRGRVAASAAKAAVDKVDADLVAREGADAVGYFRSTLGALIEMADDLDTEA